MGRAAFQLGNGRVNADASTPPRHRTLILDLGDVLFHYSSRYLTALSRQEFQAVLLTPTWAELDRGRIGEDEALAKIGKDLSLDPKAIKEGLTQCRKTLCVDKDLVDEIAKIKKEMDGHLKVYAMSNISKHDFAHLKTVLSDWSMFDGEFTSCDAGMAKPELNFYKYVLDTIGVSDPSSAIFVDDKIINVTAARSFGIQGLVFKSAPALLRQLRNTLFDPVVRARKYMATNAHKHTSHIEDGTEFPERFSQFLIHWELKEPAWLTLSAPGASEAQIKADIQKASSEARTWNYFNGTPVGTTKTFPDDVDDTSMALLAFSPPRSSANPILDLMAKTRHSRDNLVLTYFDPKRPGLCPFVLVNVIRVFYHYNRGSEVKPELEYVTRILLNRAYVNGTAVYNSAEPFLYFMACLVDANQHQPEILALREPLAVALRERVGQKDDSFAVAARVLSCQKLGVWARSDIEYLKELQDCDGGWEMGWVCRFGRSQKKIGNRGVPTAFAIKALEHEHRIQGEP
ncbi:hypothetical protein GGP41_005705 [Bipolaris sorokiniana]|uniref:HAD-like protein n=2 Tax=Cochliobolus sativus TaxID=45130 RepID=A0A8H5ZFF6_COCSA|nr:uncharacterized protein COCSADRAFT_330123 [Bipolaris sorokiniana ND90Pr]EMD63650.1 hypothetical protein COCSADRAFT_330123 [Bipolaris sorokiniana ND90Pr]KAF5848301.1 hypothetical protein GGP41_005705 [Bipolaris sorokiniana]